MAVARDLWGYIDRRDHRLMQRMNRWRAPRWIRIWMIAATRMGDGWIWYGLGMMLLVYGGAQRFSAVGAAGSAAVLGIFVFKGAASGSVFISFGPHDDGVFHRAGGQLFLSFAGRRAFFPGTEHRSVAHRAGYALPERCPGRHGDGRGSRLCLHYGVRLAGYHLGEWYCFAFALSRAFLFYEDFESSESIHHIATV